MVSIIDTQTGLRQAQEAGASARQSVEAVKVQESPTVVQLMQRGISAMTKARADVAARGAAKGAALKEIGDYNQQLSDYNSQRQNYLSTDYGKLEYAKEAGIKPEVIREYIKEIDWDGVTGYRYNTPYGVVTDWTPKQNILQQWLGQGYQGVVAGDPASGTRFNYSASMGYSNPQEWAEQYASLQPAPGQMPTPQPMTHQPGYTSPSPGILEYNIFNDPRVQQAMPGRVTTSVVTSAPIVAAAQSQPTSQVKLYNLPTISVPETISKYTPQVMPYIANAYNAYQNLPITKLTYAGSKVLGEKVLTPSINSIEKWAQPKQTGVIYSKPTTVDGRIKSTMGGQPAITSDTALGKIVEYGAVIPSTFANVVRSTRPLLNSIQNEANKLDKIIEAEFKEYEQAKNQYTLSVMEKINQGQDPNTIVLKGDAPQWFVDNLNKINTDQTTRQDLQTQMDNLRTSGHATLEKDYEKTYNAAKLARDAALYSAGIGVELTAGTLDFLGGTTKALGQSMQIASPKIPKDTLSTFFKSVPSSLVEQARPFYKGLTVSPLGVYVDQFKLTPVERLSVIETGAMFAAPELLFKSASLGAKGAKLGTTAIKDFFTDYQFSGKVRTPVVGDFIPGFSKPTFVTSAEKVSMNAASKLSISELDRMFELQKTKAGRASSEYLSLYNKGTRNVITKPEAFDLYSRSFKEPTSPGFKRAMDAEARMVARRSAGAELVDTAFLNKGTISGESMLTGKGGLWQPINDLNGKGFKGLGTGSTVSESSSLKMKVISDKLVSDFPAIKNVNKYISQLEAKQTPFKYVAPPAEEWLTAQRGKAYMSEYSRRITDMGKDINEMYKRAGVNREFNPQEFIARNPPTPGRLYKSKKGHREPLQMYGDYSGNIKSINLGRKSLPSGYSLEAERSWIPGKRGGELNSRLSIRVSKGKVSKVYEWTQSTTGEWKLAKAYGERSKLLQSRKFVTPTKTILYRETRSQPYRLESAETGLKNLGKIRDITKEYTLPRRAPTAKEIADIRKYQKSLSKTNIGKIMKDPLAMSPKPMSLKQLRATGKMGAGENVVQEILVMDRFPKVAKGKLTTNLRYPGNIKVRKTFKTRVAERKHLQAGMAAPPLRITIEEGAGGSGFNLGKGGSSGGSGGASLGKYIQKQLAKEARESKTAALALKNAKLNELKPSPMTKQDMLTLKQIPSTKPSTISISPKTIKSITGTRTTAARAKPSQLTGKSYLGGGALAVSAYARPSTGFASPQEFMRIPGQVGRQTPSIDSALKINQGNAQVGVVKLGPVQIGRLEQARVNELRLSPFNIGKLEPSEASRLREGQVTRQSKKQIQELKQAQELKTIQLTRTTQMTTPIKIVRTGMPRPLRPIVPVPKPRKDDWDDELFRKALKKKQPSSFLVSTREFGKKKIVSPYATSYGEALSLGQKVAKGTARASFELIPSMQAPRSLGMRPITPREVFASGFRTPISKGRLQPIGAGRKFVQLTGARIVSAGEKKEITFKGLRKMGKQKRGFF